MQSAHSWTDIGDRRSAILRGFTHVMESEKTGWWYPSNQFDVPRMAYVSRLLSTLDDKARQRISVYDCCKHVHL